MAGFVQGLFLSSAAEQFVDGGNDAGVFFVFEGAA